MMTKVSLAYRSLVSTMLVSTLAVGLFLAGLICSSAALAQDAPKQEGQKKEEKPKVEEKVETGVIASSGSYGRAVGLNISTDGSSPGDQVNVISASVSRLNRGQCQASLTNTSEENSYSISFKVMAVHPDSGAKLAENFYTASLKPKQSVQRNWSCPNNGNLQIVLQSAKKIGK